MNPSNPNQELNTIRIRLVITTREAVNVGQKIADPQDNREFHISHTWLVQVENSDAIPGIRKLYSLSAIYRTHVSELFPLFGINLRRLGRYRLVPLLRHTRLTSLETADLEKALTLPIGFDSAFEIHPTTPLSRMVEVCGQSPSPQSNNSTFAGIFTDAWDSKTTLFPQNPGCEDLTLHSSTRLLDSYLTCLQ